MYNCTYIGFHFFTLKLSESEMPGIYGMKDVITNVLAASQRFMREQKVIVIMTRFYNKITKLIYITIDRTKII